MSAVDWGALAARARGLSGHLATRRALEELALLGEPAALGRELPRRVRLLAHAPLGSTVGERETAIRRAVTTELATLGRYSAGGPLQVFHAEQERRALRALFRGAAAGVPFAERTAGLLPTPRLPERALQELARQSSPREVGAQLVLLMYPGAGELLSLAAGPGVAHLELELALARAQTKRSLVAARAGDAHLRRFVAERIDLGNLRGALLLAGGGGDVDPSSCFLPGGRALSSAGFAHAARATDRRSAGEVLFASLEPGWLRDCVRDLAGDPALLERRALARGLAEERAWARREPLGSAPLLAYLLLLEAQAADLYRLVFAAALGAPAAQVRAQLVTPWS